MLRIVDQGVISRQPGRGAYMPVITRLARGGYLASQHVGKALASADGRLEVLSSRDGRTFEPLPSNLAELQEGGWSYRGPEIYETFPGKLLMTATRFRADDDDLFDPSTEALARPELLLFRSDNCGRSWSPFEVIPVDLDPARYTWNFAGRMLRPAPDRWLLFFETWKPDGFAGPPDQKAGMLVSRDEGRTWGELTVVADDTSGNLLYWDQMGCVLADGRLFNMLWTHRYGTQEDLPVHVCWSGDAGRTWTSPMPTNLRGQVCTPIPLADGRVAAVYNYRHEPQGVRVALSDDLVHFDLAHEAVIFDAGAEAALGKSDAESFLAHHALIGFGKPSGHREPDGDLLAYFWCTSQGVTHTRWARLEVDSAG